MRSHEIRERFLRFFEERGHVRLPSAPLIPHDDPSILFTVAGMVPLKPYIAGLRTPPSPRLASAQKCFRGGVLRYDDIASSGDATHNTFFEMLGNWSIGDYFKQGAIDLAWELTTGVFGLDPGRVWVSIFPEDTASALLWTDRIGVPRERVVELAENWWAAGPTGPCGYDSEMYWDDGGPCSCGRPSCTPADECGGDRWVEFWNLVFMEFDQQEDGSRPLLPKPTVDTGMGLERMTRILQNVRSIFATDLFVPLIDDFRTRASRPEPAAETTRSFNVLADHLRGAAFLIADGVLPANEGRGYVLRRLIRRAAVHARRVELRGGLADGVPIVVELMGSVYPELTASGRLIEETLRAEEAVFTRTLEAASRRFDALVGDGGARIAGEDAFRLYDTYGLPIELTVEMAAERGADVDMAGFSTAMAAQREQSRSSATRVGFGGESLPESRFVGYDVLETAASVLRIGAAEPRDVLRAGERSEVVLDVSPFYAEAGGQVGDTGRLTWSGGSARVLDTTYAAGGARLQHVRVDEGALRAGDRVDAAVDAERRAQAARHHSATHLLNRALRDVFGDAVVQRGSLVTPDHTTFDFSFARALEPEELTELEHLVNDAVRRDLVRTAEEMPLAAARASGAVALLDETYGDLVRVIDFGGWSRELCGGTHVARTGEIGAVIIAGESSIGQGKRRIDMVAGEAAEQRWRDLGRALQTAGRALRVPGEQVPERVSALQDQVRKLAKDLDAARRGGGGSALGAATLEDVSGIKLAHLMLDPDQADGVREAADRLFAERLQGDGVAAVLGGTAMAVKVGGRALDAGLSAGALVSAASAATGAAGGGRRDFASGGVKDPAKRDAALRTIRAAVEEAALAGFEGRG